ncbi:DNA polymerase alpha 70 kDa subunit [Hortaea werneckii]|nr:DNA polymerase alpha 70 kDa subunit [Hortaea werneckii]KAI7097050.1 DNA polymerase alpha 70 kDa subunit [Hortaea werneckii]KAI7220617.1 DNA polymerase alpha 70 kDa subunit [Hortaea werneckii]KAI7300553.1 DNA polymerase alpha 70 kDa subunit [Hortaea werneckii]KAI7474002.1 DNA polymerase alpha 70 kDa subunit [Hortaea werneckii]
MASTQEINDAFGTTLPDDVAAELQHIVRLLDLNPQEVFFKWESYVIKMGVDSTKLDLKTVRDFKKDLQDALERESRAKGQHVAHGSSAKKTSATPRATGGDVFGMLDGMVTPSVARSSGAHTKRKAANFDTPASKSTKAGLNSSPADSKTPIPARPDLPGVSFADRQNAGQIVESINGHLPAASTSVEPAVESRTKLKANVEIQKFGYKTMAMKLSEASEVLDDRIDMFTDLIQEHYQLPDTAFGNPAAQSTAEIVAVGRIACDQPNGKLNAASVVIETSRRMGAGLRIPLKFQDGVAYDVFPGKIMACRGTNVSGEYFSVAEILPIPQLPPPASSPLELDVHNDRLTDSSGDTTPLNMMVASGPYTTDTDLDFTPLHTLLDRANDTKADALILCGPFLDIEHPIVASGDFEPHLPANTSISPDRATLADIFRHFISQPLQTLLHASPTTTIILVPSLRDALSKHVAWPQDRFAKPPLGLPKGVHVVTNPILLSINEILVGISTQDILSELRRENIAISSPQHPSEDTLARLTRALIDQRHFFPLFPPQARENLPALSKVSGEVPDPGSEERLPMGACVDLSYVKLAEWVNVKPDLLVLPSALSPFAKVVEGVTALNPGPLMKKRGAGTFAALSIQPRRLSDEEREAAETPVGHMLYERARVDVVKI